MEEMCREKGGVKDMELPCPLEYTAFLKSPCSPTSKDLGFLASLFKCYFSFHFRSTSSVSLAHSELLSYTTVPHNPLLVEQHLLLFTLYMTCAFFVSPNRLNTSLRLKTSYYTEVSYSIQQSGRCRSLFAKCMYEFLRLRIRLSTQNVTWCAEGKSSTGQRG